jgi:predicted TPR repeat methyltransferase
VEGLFDGYAPQFEAHLVQQLGYRAPEQLLALLPQSERWAQALDLGCGSGLAAPLLAPRCDALDGVDLSSRMLELAEARGLYRELVHAEGVAYLWQHSERYGLVFAADMFIYVGALDSMFAAAKGALLPRGRLVFSAEESLDGRELVLAPSTRFLHSQAYVRRLAAAQGFEVAALERGPLRREQQHLITGLFVVLTRI